VLARATAVAEQEDIHLPTATVREALLFSARLRLGGPVSHEQRCKLITVVMTVLELTAIGDRLVGTLSRGEAKRLTIGVELVSSPSLIFLDE
jgi:ATP-binding cassette subfamily G (WHITE) protein 2 (SNQ2)